MGFKYGRGITSDTSNIGIIQLRDIRQQTIDKWSKLGLLDGLIGHSDINPSIFESQLSYKIEGLNRES